MTKSHKDINRWPLLAALVANFLLYTALAKNLELAQLSTASAVEHLKTVFPGGLALALTSIVNAQLTHLHKARIVFWRWDHPLPGSRVFSELAQDDYRIDLAEMKKRWSPLPTDPREQNSLWYRLYQSQQASPAIGHLDRNWLFARDYACVVALLIPILSLAAAIQFSSLRSYLTLLAALVMQFLLARQAAKNYADRFVTTVVAQALANPSTEHNTELP